MFVNVSTMASARPLLLALPWWGFGPLAGLAFALSGLAAWLAWDSGHDGRNGAIAWWLIHLVLLVAWAFVFFGMNRSGWGQRNHWNSTGRSYESNILRAGVSGQG